MPCIMHLQRDSSHVLHSRYEMQFDGLKKSEIQSSAEKGSRLTIKYVIGINVNS